MVFLSPFRRSITWPYTPALACWSHTRRLSWTTFSYLTTRGRRVLVITGSYSRRLSWTTFYYLTTRGRRVLVITGSYSSAKRFSPLSAEVKLYIDQLVALNPSKTTPGTTMGCLLVEHASFADRHFPTGTCRRAHTTRKFRAYRDNASRAKQVACNIGSRVQRIVGCT
jgi:hypothetical protein